MLLTNLCDVPGEDLVAYVDDELSLARRQFIEEHLGICTRCQHRVATFTEVDHLLLRETFMVDDPLGKEMTKGQLMSEFAQRSRRSTIQRLLAWLFGHA